MMIRLPLIRLSVQYRPEFATDCPAHRRKAHNASRVCGWPNVCIVGVRKNMQAVRRRV